jgi:hypothetical protein
MINCTLTPAQLENLYKHLYASMIGTQKFDPMGYMKDLYLKIKSRSSDAAVGEANAVKFLQNVPRLMAEIALSDNKVNLDFNKLVTLKRDFENVESGFGFMISELGKSETLELSINALKDLYNQRFNQPYVEDTEIEEFIPLPTSGLTSTFQQLVPLDSQLADGKLEKINEQRKITFDVFNYIRTLIARQENLKEKLSYRNLDGSSTNIKLLAISGEDFYTKLKNKEIVIDSVSKAAIEKSRALVNKKQNLPGITSIIQRDFIVLSDENGNILHFDKNGDVVSKEEGTAIFSYMRIIEKNEDGKYKALDYMGNPAVADPFKIASRSVSLNGFLIEAQQQKEFEIVYNIQQKIKTQKDKPVLLNIEGVSSGVVLPKNKSTLSASELAEMENIELRELLEPTKITYVSTSQDGFTKGQNKITVKDKQFLLEKPAVPENIIQDIITVLSDPNISIPDKVRFHNQFFPVIAPNDLKNIKKQSHTLYYSENSKKDNGKKDSFLLKFYDEENKGQVVYIQNNTLTEEQKEKLAFYLRTGNRLLENRGPAIMHFSKDGMKNIHLVYDRQKQKLVNGSYENGTSYVDFLISLNLEINTIPANVNPYLHFSEITELEEAVDQFVKETENPVQTEYGDKVTEETVNEHKEKLEALKERLTFGDEEIDNVTQANTGRLYGFTHPELGKVDFYKVKDTGVTVDLNSPIVIMNDFGVNEAGESFEGVGVYQNGERIGWVRETADFNTKKPETKIKDERDIDDNSISFDRNKNLGTGATAQQNAKAQEWFENSPLSKFIAFEHLTGVVNSDAFAKFIVDGSTLISPNMLGKIQLFGDGNMIDVYHEAWHGFSQLFMTKSEKIKLYNEVRNSNDKYKNLSLLEIEELLAEDFRSYAINPKTQKNSPVRNSLFRRILNFLKSLFGKINTDSSDGLARIPAVKELYDNLYFASSKPELLNKYKPSLENVMFTELNRAKTITSVTNSKLSIMSVSESTEVSNALDSIISEIVDHNITTKNNKAYALALLRKKNRNILYRQIQIILENKEKELKALLGESLDTKFNTLTTEKQLALEAPVIIKRNDDSIVYGFVSSQISDLSKLTPDIKKGAKVRGQNFYNINIVTDFYTHSEIKDKNGEPIKIVIGNSIEEIRDQYFNFKDDQVSSSWQSMEIKETPAQALTNEQIDILNELRIVEKTLSNWGDGERGVIAYHLNNTRYQFLNQDKFDNTFNTEDLTDEEGNELDITDPETGKDSEDFADRKVGKKSVWDTAHPELKYIISSLHTIDKETGKPITGLLGYKKLADSHYVWAQLLKRLENKSTDQEMYDELLSMHKEFKANPEKYPFPEIEQLLLKIPSPEESAKNSASFDTFSALFHTFNKFKAPYLQVLHEETTSETYETKVVMSTMQDAVIVTRWQNAFQVQQPKTIEDKEIVFINEENKRQLNLDNVIKIFGLSNDKTQLEKKDRPLFLRSIGINMDNISVINSELINAAPEAYGIPYIYEAIKAIHDLNKLTRPKTEEENKLISSFMTNPVKVLASKFKIGNKEYDNKTNLKRLAALQAEKGIEAINSGVPNAAGDTVYPHVDYSTVTRIGNALQKASSLAKLFEVGSEFEYMKYLNPAHNPYTTRLKTIQNLFNVSQGKGLRNPSQELLTFMYSGTQIAYSNGSKEGVNTTDLTGSDFLNQNINAMLLQGIQEIPRVASKKTSMGMKLNKPIRRNYTTRRDDSHLYIDSKTFLSAQEETEAIQEFLIPYLAGEFDRIRIVKNNREKYKNYKGYNREITVKGKPTRLAGEVFTAFDGVLKDSTKELLYDLITEENSNVSLEVLLSDPANNFINDLVIAEIKNYFNNMTKDTITVQGDSMFISSDILERTGQDNKTNQEFAAVKTYNYNSWIQNFETAILIFGDFAQYNHAKEEYHKRTSGATSSGPGFRNSASARAFINNQFLTNTYAGAKYGISHAQWTGVLNTAVIEDVERKESIYLKDIEPSLTTYYKSLGLPDKVVSELVKKDISAYKGMTEGDGAGYITLDSYRILKKLENDWSEIQEDLFNQIVKGEKLDPNLIAEFYSPYKLQAHGHLQNDGLPALAMHKFALFPLIPGMIEGSHLESLHKQMLAKGINYVTFASGSKGVSISSNGKPDKIYNNDGSFNSDIQFTPNLISVEYVKKSSATNNYFKKSIPYPTQKRGLLLNHLYNQGFSKDKLKDVAKEYEAAVAEYSEIVRLELLDEIGYTYNPETNTYTGNHKKFVDLINKTLEEREIPKHLLEVISTDLKGNITHDLSYHVSADKIEKLLTSLIEKRLIKQNVLGEPLIQMPSSMLNGIWDTSPEIVDSKDPKVKELLGTNNLAFYGKGEKTSAMHIAIALQGPFKNLLKAKYKDQEIGTIDRLNEAIKDPEWFKENEALITIVGDRIPIQDHGSLEFARIWHFLPESSTNVVVVPTEIVAKAGSDFDVDKIFWQFPEIDNSGKLFTSDLSVQDINKLLNSTDPKAKAKVKQAIAQKKKAINNRLIQANIDILSNPEIYPYLVKPNNTYLWQDIAQELEKYYEDEYNRFNNYSDEGQITLIVKDKEQRAISPTKTLEPLYQMHKLVVNMVGKDGLGVVALANKIHPILVSAGAKMPLMHYEIDNEGNITGISHPIDLMFDHNKTDQGAVSLSHEYNVNKVKIADMHSHLMNGLVDVEKDAWVFYVRANLEQLPTLLYLSEAGVSEKEIALYLTQPLIREYVTKTGQLKGMYYKLKPKSQQIEKWQLFGELFSKVAGETFTENILLEANKARLLEAAEIKGDKKLIERINNANELAKLPNVYTEEHVFKSNKNIGNRFLIPYIEKILKEKSGIEKFTKKNLLDNLDESNMLFSLLSLVNYVKIENQTSEYNNVKTLFNPDTKVSKTATASYSREQAFAKALENPNVDKDTLRRLKEESVLKSFFTNDIAMSLLKPMFELRLNEKVLNYVLETQRAENLKISKRFGKGQEGKDKFNAAFSNGLITHIWQNSMAYMLDENGNRTALPKTYGSFDIVRDDTAPEVTQLKGNVLSINMSLLNKTFSTLTKQQLKVWPNIELFTKFYLELAVQRTMYPEKSKRELQERARIFAFNPYALQVDGYSKKIMELVEQHNLKNKYSVLDLLHEAEYPSKNEFSVLTLGDKRNISPELATEFAGQLKQLADETVSKVDNKALNYEISEYFKIFSEVLLFQHGAGYSLDGINNVLNIKKITELLDKFGQKFIEQELSKENPSALTEVKKHVLDRTAIKNFTNTIAADLTPGMPTAPAKLTTTQSSTSVNPADFTNHSGGAKGYDAEWDLIGKEFGMVNNKHYLLPSDGAVSDPRLQAKGVKPVDATSDVGEVALQGPATGEAQIAVTNAERAMGRIEPTHTTRNTKKIRNYAQVKNADGIFAIGSLIPKGSDITVARGQATKKALVPQVNGGTSVAVQLGITMGKPTYVFNQVANPTYSQGWYQWNASKQDFVSINTPVLTKNFAGIGTSSNTTEQGKQAIRDVYANTFKATTQLPTSAVVKPGVEISSNAKGLAAALTNPTELAKSKGNLTESYPVEFRGKTYKDAEAAYQALKSTATKDEGPNSTYNLMVDIIKAKLEQYPRLVSEIINQGGSAWILSSTHQPTKQNSVWETGGKNWFIKSLNDAYLSTQPSTSVESKRTFKNEEYHQAYIKGGLAAVQEFIQKNKQKEMSAAKQLSKEVDMLTEFEDLNTKTNKTNSDNDRLIELYVLLKNSKELDFEYSLNQIGLSTQPSTQQPTEVKEGVKELFDFYPELANIGTPEQYSEWINYLTTQGKLAGTSATEILYHGTDQEFETFDKTKRGSATGESYFEDEEKTPIDSLNAFFFSTDSAVSEQYGLLKRVQLVNTVTSILGQGVGTPSQLTRLRELLPDLYNHLKEKQTELSKEDLKNYIKQLYLRYSATNRKLGVGFLNQYNNYVKLGKQLQDLKNKKEDIISGRYVHNSFIKNKPDLGISFYNKEESPLAMGIHIYNDGEIKSGEFNKRNITSLSSQEFDRLIAVGEKSYKAGIEELNTTMSKAKITPLLYRVLLNVQKPLVKDFEGKTFVNQAYEAGAQYEASKLTNQAAKSKGEYDSVIFKNIRDPYLSDNYGVFEPEQIYILLSEEDIQGFKEFVSKPGQQEVSSEEKQMLNALPEFTSQIKTKSGKTLLSLGITNPEWKAMSDLEKLTLLKCN